MNFLDAINAGFAVKNAKDTVKGVKRFASEVKKKKAEDDAAVPFPDPQAAVDAEGLAALAGGYADEREEDSAPIGNIPTEAGEPDEDLYRITSGDEDIPEFSYEDLVGAEGARDMTAGLAVEDEAPMGNISVAPAEAPTKPATNNPLIDPTIGARRAGIPEETTTALFKKTHGGSFDPNSKTDRLKLKVIEDMINEDSSLLELSPAKFALKVYARK